MLAFEHDFRIHTAPKDSHYSGTVYQGLPQAYAVVFCGQTMVIDLLCLLFLTRCFCFENSIWLPSVRSSGQNLVCFYSKVLMTISIENGLRTV